MPAPTFTPKREPPERGMPRRFLDFLTARIGTADVFHIHDAEPLFKTAL